MELAVELLHAGLDLVEKPYGECNGDLSPTIPSRSPLRVRNERCFFGPRLLLPTFNRNWIANNRF
jgi:hypothetical protein